MIELDEVSRIFILGEQAVHAVDRVSLTIERGEYLSIMGPSGSGKSTLLNLIALLDRPDGGNYRFNGSDVATLSDDALADERRHSIGFIFQSFHLIARLTAAENVELPLILDEVSRDERRRRVAAALRSTGIEDRAAHRPSELSGGQQQRVAIARAIIMQPELILADEPTGNLDSSSGGQVVELLERLRNDFGVTLIVVTHDPALGMRAERRIRMVDGRIDQDLRGERAQA